MAKVCVCCGSSLSTWDKLLKDCSLCPSCRDDRKEKVAIFLQRIDEFGRDNYLTHNEHAEIKRTIEELGLYPDEIRLAQNKLSNLMQMTRFNNVKRFENALGQVAEDGEITDEELELLSRLQVNLGLQSQEVQHTYGFIRRLQRLSAIKQGDLPVYQTDLLLRKGEHCHFVISVRLIEEKTRREYVGGTQGVSLRIMKGMTYRIGGFKGQPIETKYREHSDRGTLYVTNRRIVFSGSKKTITYPLGAVVDFVKYTNAVEFRKANEGHPRFFLIDHPDAIDEIGLIVSVLVSQA